MSHEIPININWMVRFRLRASGVAYLSSHIEEASAFLRDAGGGWYRCHLWELIRVFGPAIRFGSDSPIETEIVIEPDAFQTKRFDTATPHQPAPPGV